MKPSQKLPLITFMSALLTFAVLPAFGQETGAVSSGDAPESTRFSGVEAFIDGAISAQMRADNVAGAAVAVVHHGEVILSKGYGYADVDTRRAVDPEATMFRIASITKLFTWTAVMQLVEQGKLDLDADVQNYIDFKIPSPFDRPITIRNLMTHTAGFEDRAFAIASEGLKPSAPLGQWLATHVPARIWRPGEIVAYSNYGAALAGYVVERVTGMSYDDYVERHIFQPLGMSFTTVRQPVAGDIQDQAAVGYTHYKGRFYAKEFEVYNSSPAGAASSTASDMARYMIAILQGGSLQGIRIAEAGTVAAMLSQAFSYHPQTNAMALGFIEMDANGHTAVGHDGDTLYFHSLLVILPEQDAGLFVSYNSASADGLPKELFRLFVDRYFPPVPSPGAAGNASERTSAQPAESTGDLSRFTGRYDWSRANFTTTERLESLFSEVRFVATADNMLVTSNPASNMRLVQTGPLHFADVNDGQTVTFIENDRKVIVYAALSGWPDMLLIKQKWYQTDLFNLAAILIIAGVFVSVVVGTAARRVTRRRRTVNSPTPTAHSFVERFGWAAHVTTAFGLIALALGVKSFIDNYIGIMQGSVSLVIPRVAAALIIVSTAFALAATAFVWKQRAWRMSGRICYSLVTVSSMGLVWWLSHWNLLWVRM